MYYVLRDRRTKIPVVSYFSMKQMVMNLFQSISLRKKTEIHNGISVEKFIEVTYVK